MDLWVVAAAAGAGYVAKFLKKTKEKEGLAESISEDSDSSSGQFFEQLPDNTCFNRKLGRQRLRGEGEGMPSSSPAAFLGTSSSNDFGSSELTSTSGFDDELLEKYGSNEDYNLLSLSSLPRGFPTKSNYQESSGDRIKGNKDEFDKTSHRSKTAIRSKKLRRNSVKPLSSLDSCLIAHLYNEHVGMEEYVFSPFPSPSASTVRPLLVTDGSRIISRANSDSCSMQCKLYKEDSVYSGVKEIVAGVPSLPGINRLQLPKKPKQKRGQEFRGGRPTNRNTQVSGNQLHLLQGPSDRMFVFCLGITFGVMSTVMGNKTEVDKLNELLKQTESLVQDLQEELEMKDSLTVKVLTHEGCESQENNDHYLVNQAVTSFSSARETYESVEYDIKRTVDQNSNENSESMSKIEAELEAELERLELNMNASSLERRLSGLVELDPDSGADFVQGELRVDMVNGEAGNRIDSSDMSGSSTTQRENVNYAVSPQELSLRLHEVIRSRLEERIVELETALESSQKRLHSVEPKKIFCKNYSASEIESSSQASPVTREESNPMAEPLFLNLSDDALDAYNEAYEALSTRITGTDEESPPFMAYKSNLSKEGLHSSDRSVLWSQNGSGSNGAVETEEESDDDEMARLLIKQLVEKTRQGSPVVLNAQRMLFSMDEKSQLK